MSEPSLNTQPLPGAEESAQTNRPILVSYVKSATDTATRDYDAKEIIEQIRTDNHLRDEITEIRDEYWRVMAATNNDRKAAKKAVGNRKKRLPGATWSGKFSRRKQDALLQHSGLLCADLDELGRDKVAEVRAKLQKSVHLWALFPSPTGDGLKAIFRVPADPAKHKESFRSVKKHVHDLTGLPIDEACSDVSRLCFLSHDPGVCLNEKAVELPPLVETESRENPVPPPVSDAKLEARRRITEDVLGRHVRWDGTSGYCTCPAHDLHTSGDGDRDCEVYLDRVPTIHCFHQSCLGIIAGINHELRSRIRKAEGMSKPEPVVRKLLDLERASTDDPNTLLGNRFLCRGGGLTFIGSAGIGKSTAVIQMAISWSVGRACFAITPARPLKILYIQAENDEGDLCEMRDGVLEHLELSDEERETLKDNFVCVFESSRTGEELIGAIGLLLQQHSPDLLVLDPALSYIGGDVNQQEIVGRFLRNLLNPLLQTNACGALVVHHTPKPSGDRDGRRKKMATDFAYAGGGSAEWGNWPRAILVLSAKDDNGLRELRIAKRFRLDWKDAKGSPTATRLLRQNAEGGSLFYTELSASESMLMSDKSSPADRVLHSDILPEPGEDVEKKMLIARITERKICGRDKAMNEVLPSLIDRGYLEEKEVARRTGRPAIHLVRTSKKPNVMSFAGPAANSTDGVGPIPNAS
ncbi:MAG: BT4734/BF3469 family protein [Chthoniobacterales bacterium]